jgi:hypothetical protein
MSTETLELSVVLPCLNEAETLAVCVQKARHCLTSLGVDAEVLISDNGSTDGSQEIAQKNGARVVAAPIRGYGGALLAGISAARGRYIIMSDSDDSYDLSNLAPFIEALRAGHDVVMGNRFKGGIAPGAMPFLHRYLGNPVLTWIGRVLFGVKNVGDFHCGMRGFNKRSALALGLCMTGMEFASELVVRAALAGYSIVEVPTTLRPDGRSRPPHLRTWRDGWRHLRFLLVFAPRKTLVWPGALLGALGLVAMTTLALTPIKVGAIGFDVNSLVYACLASIVGTQLLLFGGFAELYGWREGIARYHHVARWTKWLQLERCVAVGLSLLGCGAAGTVKALTQWGEVFFGALDPTHTIRLVLVSATAIAIGTMTIFAGFFTSLLTLRSTAEHNDADPYTADERVSAPPGERSSLPPAMIPPCRSERPSL